MSKWINNWMEFCKRLQTELKLRSLFYKRGLRRLRQQLLLALFATVLISACSSATIEHSKMLNSDLPSTPCRVVQHLMGDTCIPNHPKRVIVISDYGLVNNALTLGVKPIGSSMLTIEELNRLGMGESIQGVQEIGSAGNPSLEKILLLKPDFILAWEPAKRIYPMLSKIAPTVVVPFDMPNWNEPKWKAEFDFVAEVLEKEVVAQQVWDQYYQRIEELKVALGNRYHDQTISVANLGTHAYSIDVKNSFAGSILDELGLQRPSAQNVVMPSGGIWNISYEKLEKLDGDILFVFVSDKHGQTEAYEAFRNKPLWKTLKAVQSGQVYPVDLWSWNWGDPSTANLMIDDLYRYLVDIS